MKNTKLILTGLLTAVIGSTASYATTYTSSLLAGGSLTVVENTDDSVGTFLNELNAMTAAFDGLKTGHNTVPTSGDTIEWSKTLGQFSGYQSDTSLASSRVFSYMDDGPTKIALSESGSFDIGFIGFEAADTNSFGWSFADRETLEDAGGEIPITDPSLGDSIFTSPDDKGMSYNFQNDSTVDPLDVFLWAYDPYEGPEVVAGYESSYLGEDHFGWERLEVFEYVIDASEGQYAYLILMDDRFEGGGNTSDYDDMAIYLVTDGAVVVPEPATVGLIALAGVVGFVAYRRRRS